MTDGSDPRHLYDHLGKYMRRPLHPGADAKEVAFGCICSIEARIKGIEAELRDLKEAIHHLGDQRTTKPRRKKA